MPRKYEMAALYDAYHAVKEGNMSINAAATLYGVPRRTLGDRVHGRISLNRKGYGPQPLFSEIQERALVHHLKKMEKLGRGYKRKELTAVATAFAIHLGLRTVDEPSIGKSWYAGFRRRWKTYKYEQPQHLDICRTNVSSKDDVASYFLRLGECIKNYSFNNRPDLIYNIDEMGLSSEFQPLGLVAGRKGTGIVTLPRLVTTTLIGAGNAAGTAIPPFFVFKGKQMQKQYLEGKTPGTDGCTSSTGLLTPSIFMLYLQQHFIHHVSRKNKDEPLLLLYDGRVTDQSTNLVNWAKENNIILFVLPSQTSHYLQPLFVACFGPLESAFIIDKHERISGPQDGFLENNEVCSIACDAYEQSFTKTNITSAFQETGIYPFTGISTVKVDSSILLNSSLNEKLKTSDDNFSDFFSEKERVFSKGKTSTKNRKESDLEDSSDGFESDSKDKPVSKKKKIT